LDKNGVIAFVSNNSFLDARSYDGFRKVVAEEFNEIYIIDLKGDARTSGERRRREGGNVFSDQIRVGVAIYFLVRKEGETGCRIHYNAVPDYASAAEKKAYLRESRFADLQFQTIHPDDNHNWLHLTENDWDGLIPVASKEAKAEFNSAAVFSLVSPGIVTARDEWVIDFSRDDLSKKMSFFVRYYSEHDRHRTDFDTTIKWSRNLKRRFEDGLREEFSEHKIIRYTHRPFTNYYIYYSQLFLDEVGWASQIVKGENCAVSFTNPASNKPFSVLVSRYPVDFHLNGDTQYLPLFRYADDQGRQDNITDWALARFQQHYPDQASQITKQAIFHYVYAVLHHPAYRTKYERNLKREFPRIPFYDDFWQWAAWGEQLMALHLDYEQVARYPLAREDKDLPGLGDLEGVRTPKPRLIARKEAGVIEIDAATTLHGVPTEAWDYRLGTYSALEWVLERYKERTPKDPTIREKFNTYRFVDHKVQVIDLLCRVCTVSVETMKIIQAMPMGG
jgi:predicted helicase